MIPKKSEACARAAYEATTPEPANTWEWQRVWFIGFAEVVLVEGRHLDATGNLPQVESAILAASHAWDAALSAASDAIDAAKDLLECEEASGAADALQAVEALRAGA